MNSSRPRHHARFRVSTAQIVAELCEALGLTLVAVIAGAKSVETAKRWSTGRGRPTPKILDRLRSAHVVLRMLRDHEDAATIRAWFRGMNTYLDDASPARVLQRDPGLVIEAAEAWLQLA